MADPTPSGANTLYYTLVLDANDFMANLKGAQGQAMSFDQTMAAMQGQVKHLMEEFGIDAPTAISVLQKVRGEVDLDAEAIARLQEVARQGALRQVGADMREAEFAGMSLESTLRMIEGVLVSMAVFQGIQMIAQAFNDAVKNATEYFNALQNITVAQSALAQAGVSITNQQMLDIVNQLHEKWQTISQVDITSAVAQAGLMASEYHLSVEQMTQLANEAAILHQLDPSKPMADYVTQLAKALEGGRSLALNGEQIAITNDELLAKAKELNLVAEDYKGKLTDQQKIVAGLAIEYDRLHPEEQKLTEEIKSGTSALVQNQEATAKWKDLTTAVGEYFVNIGAVLAPIGVKIAEIVFSVARWLSTTILTVEAWVAGLPLIEAIAGVIYAIGQLMEGNVHSVQDFVKAWKDGLSSLTDWLTHIKDLQNAINPNNLGAGAGTLSGLNFGNTPVGPGGDVTGASNIDESKLQSILDSVAKDYQSYYDSVEKATEDFNNRMQNLQDQYNLSVQKLIEDTNLRMAQEQADFHLKELQQEQDFQLKMQELKNQYLMDLEDGLRKQDAEAVIKTMEKYQNQKTIDQQQEALKLAQDKQNEKLKLEQMKQEEQLRLKQLAEEYKLQQEEAQRAYALQLQQLQQSLDQKLQEEAVKAQQDLGLNQSSIDAIYKLFTEYYGSNGLFAQTQQGAYTQMIQQSQGFVDQMAAIMQEYAAVLSSLGAVMPGGTPGGGAPKGVGGTHPKFAGGGMALAASATDVTFGEAGPELAMFLPLNASPTSMSVSGLGGGGGGGLGGRAIIALQLSPDLEAHLVSTTLTHAAISIERIYGSR